MLDTATNALDAVPNRSKTKNDTNPAPCSLERAKGLFSEMSLSCSDAARAIGTSKTSIHRGLTLDQWPRAMRVKNDFVQWVVMQAKLAGVDIEPTPAASPNEVSNQAKGEVEMLLQKSRLSHAAKEFFGLNRDPFSDEMESQLDIYLTPSVRYVRASMMDCAVNHGFLAVVAESGAGKSTMAEALEEQIAELGGEIIVIRPYVLGMESNDVKGKTLRSHHIAEAICSALEPEASLKRSPQARFAQLHKMLKDSRKSGRKHLLLIEEAHCLPIATLKHLKRFLELKDGMKRLIGVTLIGQTELRDLLGGSNAAVREVSQRCELVELEPLNAHLEEYIKHKFARAGAKAEDVLEATAYGAIRERLTHTPRGGKAKDERSIAFPLVVNNLVSSAMNKVAALHFGKVDASAIQGA